MDEDNPIENFLKRDRAIVVGALLLLMVVSWLYVLIGAGMPRSAFDMSSLSMALGETIRTPADGSMVRKMEGAIAAMTTPVDWTFDYAILMFFMWWIMMVAMMLPSATPTILLHALVSRKARLRTGEPSPPWPTAGFTLGYLLIWAAFSAVAAALQWAFEESGVLSPTMLNGTGTVFAGTILVFAGLYQLTPIKQACLRHCRGPISFLSRHWRSGSIGALIMGLHHGAYCLGCCWALMTILFFGGIMNLYWILALAFIVLIEKLMPFGRGSSVTTGILLIAWGSSFLYRAII